MKKLTLLFLLLLLPASARAGEILRDKSKVGFISKQMGVPIEGEFRRFDADVVFDPEDLRANRAEITIYPESIDAGSDEATVEVKRKAWFDAANYPKARFVSSTLARTGKDSYIVTGKMTIKGVTRDAQAPFTVKREKDAWLFEGAFTLKRLDFRIGEGAWADTGTVADEVKVSFSFLVPYKKNDQPKGGIRR